jgi:cytochrome o ubiquinol oxidase subunit II
VGKKNKNSRRIFITAFALWFVGIIAWYLHDKNFAVLNPGGSVAAKERNLMVVTALLGLLVIVPVYIMLFSFAWRYREGNKKAKFSPELSGNRWLEAIWWGIPAAIIMVLSIITWNSSHALDPHKALPVAGKPAITIQVVALDWKWLFIYPKQNVASVNWLQLPVGTPVNFIVTADAPMNSFWIPQLGSQIYAMPGMSTQLHLLADKAGYYQGSSANISGRGFAGMRFMARAGSDKEFGTWLQAARRSPLALSAGAYRNLAKQSENNPVAIYSSVEPSLYDKVVLKYMTPGGQ